MKNQALLIIIFAKKIIAQPIKNEPEKEFLLK
jgi:hypothetical protein